MFKNKNEKDWTFHSGNSCWHTPDCPKIIVFCSISKDPNDYLEDSLESFCQVNFLRNFSTESPPVYLATRLVGRTWLGPESAQSQYS